MRFLFVHQNFPGQFGHVAGHLARADGNRVMALHYRAGLSIDRIETIQCTAGAPATGAIHPWVRQFDQQVRSGQATATRAHQLKRDGFTPDLIIGHPGWGETLFLKDVWANTPIVSYPEYYYGTQGADTGFDREFDPTDGETAGRIRIKNSANLHALVDADRLWFPTEWQRSTLPGNYRSRATVIHDGIDTEAAQPDSSAWISVETNQGTKVTFRPGDEVVTFVARNLEPPRGFHVFMRALPAILAQRPKAQAIVIGGDEAGYGLPPKGGGTWRERMLAELGSQLDLSRVHFVGKVAKPTFIKVLQVSAVHVYLTYPFIVSWSLLEAMSTGCRILASRTAPVTEFIDDGVNGTLFDFFRADALAAKAIEILCNQNNYEAQRAAARQTILQRCDLRSVCLPAQLRMIEELTHRG